MINEKSALALAHAPAHRRRLVTALSTSLEAPPRSVNLSRWLWLALAVGLVVALVTA